MPSAEVVDGNFLLFKNNKNAEYFTNKGAFLNYIYLMKFSLHLYRVSGMIGVNGKWELIFFNLFFSFKDIYFLPLR